MSRDIVVIDYGVGNHQSVENALKFLGVTYQISGKKRDITNASAYIFPGVGAFEEAMCNITRLGVADVLREQVMVKKKPLLGICLGMQLLAEDSQENGLHKGLGWLSGHVVKLLPTKEFRIPHVGWNNLHIRRRDLLFSQLSSDPNFYFDHSYHFACDSNAILATAWHGVEVTAAIQKNNVFGVQFHPEKSQHNGLKMLRAFTNFARKHSYA